MVEFAKCARSLDALFVLDQSGSVSAADWVKEKEFAAQLSEGLAKMYSSPQFGIIVFGPAPPPVPRPLSNITAAQISQQIRSLPGCQQFLDPRNRDAPTCTTPTDQAIAAARQQFARFGRNHTSQLLFLVTDGRPETGLFSNNRAVSQSLANETLREAEAAKREGISIVTVGIALDETTQQLMNAIASTPWEDYSYPNVASFDELFARLPTILASSCFYIQSITPTMGCAGDTISVIGENLFATDVFLKCRFTFPSGDEIIVRGHHFNNTLMHCVVPELLDGSSAIVEVTTDGQGFTDNGFAFQYYPHCVEREDNFTALGVVSRAETGTADWWPWLFFLLIPLLCCLLFCLWCCRRRRKPEERQKSRAVAVSTVETSPEDEAFQLEGLETNAVPSQKWKVQPAAYIGFGKGKMDVNWNGEAPESAPHALKRQPVDTSETSEGVPLTPSSLAHVAPSRHRKRGCCPWLCCFGRQDEPHYPRNEGEEQHLAVSVPRVVFHTDSHLGDNRTLERKDDVEG